MLNQPKDFWNMRAQTYDRTSGQTYAETGKSVSQPAQPFRGRPGQTVTSSRWSPRSSARRTPPSAGPPSSRAEYAPDRFTQM